MIHPGIWNHRRQQINTRAAGMLIVVLIALTFAIRVDAQEVKKILFDRISSENFKVEKGLSQNTVNCIMQDAQGYMWFGTWDGLNKYDGYKFDIFKPGYLKGPSDMSDQTVNTLMQDKEGTIWIGTNGGINLLDMKTRKFRRLMHNQASPGSISCDTILCLLESKNGDVWVGTNNGLNRLDRETGVFYHYFLNPDNANSPSDNTILCLFEDKQGSIWFGTNKGLNLFNTKNLIFSHYYHNPENDNTISNDIVKDILIDRQGVLWVCTDGGLDHYDFNTRKLSHFRNDISKPGSISNNHITSILEDAAGTLWVGTFGGGLNMYDRKFNRFVQYINNTYDLRTISNDYINTLYEDKSGIIWIATAWKGVNKIDRYSNRFNHYQHFSDDAESINNNIVWSILESPDGTIWLGTDNGINIYNRTKNKFTFITQQPGKSGGLTSKLIRAIYRDTKGYYWIGTFDGGLSRYDEKTRQFMHFRHDPNNPHTLTSDQIWSIIEDKEGFLWVGTDQGINRIDLKSFRIEHFIHNSKDPASLSNNYVTSMTFDSKGLLWICTNNGLNYYNFKTKKFSHYKHIPGNKYSLSTSTVFSIYEDRSGIFWIATMGGGLNRFDTKTGMFRYYLEENGLANNIVYNIFKDKQGYLWMSTNYGISRFNPETETFVNYDVKDGVQSYEFNLGAAYHDTVSDEIFFGGMNGFNSFIPSAIRKNDYIPPIVISSFKIFDQVQSREISDGDTIFLSYDDNFFSFEFSALDYSNPTKIRYSYTLENFDQYWNYGDAYKRFAGYTRVPPGTYHFRVKGTNSDGLWNKKGISVTIIISPPWWGTWYFRLLSSLFTIFILWYIVYMRLRRIRIKHEGDKKILEIEKQMFSLEQTALRLQMNPHFIFNSLNSIQSFVISNDTDKAINYLAKFSQLMRLILSNSQQQMVPVSDEIKALTYYLDIERLRFDNKFNYSIELDPQIDSDFMEIPPMIIQPFVENAIIHGLLHKASEGNVSIKLSVVNEFIRAIIEDDGIGREKAAEIRAESDLRHKSRGMLITQKRLEILNKQNKDQVSIQITDLKNEQGKACGTRIVIMMLYIEP
ncbi:MAG: two-component regulator propeller domain-containing protein [Bacteroidota bacterium]